MSDHFIPVDFLLSLLEGGLIFFGGLVAIMIFLFVYAIICDAISYIVKHIRKR